MKVNVATFTCFRPSLSANPERRMAIDFSLPAYRSHYSLAIKNPKFDMNLWSYLSPFCFDSWMAILGLVGVSALTLAFVCQLSQGWLTYLMRKQA